MKKIAWLLPLLFAAPLFAQTDAIQGYCDRGGTHSLVSGLPATNWQLGNIPACTVTVYFTGTTTKASLFADSLGTPLGNPFTATTSTSPNPGYWIFWAPVGVGYDVTMSGGGGVPTCTTQPNCYAIPITKTDLKVGGGGGGTGVTNFSAGNLPPLFTTTVTNSGTTPNLGFNLSNAPGNSIFGNFNGTSGPPFYAIFTCTGLLTCVYNSGTNTWNVNIPSTSTLSVTSLDPIKVNGTNGPVASGTAQISCPTCGQANVKMFVGDPLNSQHVVIYPTGYTVSVLGAPEIQVSNTGAIIKNPPGFRQCSGSSFGRITWTYAGALAAQAPWVVPANVTSIYAWGWTETTAASVATNCGPGPNPLGFQVGVTALTQAGSVLSPSVGQFPLTYYEAATSLNGTTVETTTAVGEVDLSGQSGGQTTYSIPALGLIVYYTGTAPPNDTSVFVKAPIMVSTASGHTVLSLDDSFPITVHSYQVANAPSANSGLSTAIYMTSTLNCTSDTGVITDAVWCAPVLSGTSYVWSPLTTGGGGTTTYFTEVVTCTTTCTLAHTPSTFDNFSVNGLVMVNGTDFTRSGTTITLSVAAVGGDIYYAQYHY